MLALAHNGTKGYDDAKPYAYESAALVLGTALPAQATGNASGLSKHFSHSVLRCKASLTQQ
jgi:hypothetical protein